MHKTLDYGFWSDYSCTDRPWIMGGGTVFVSTLFITIIAYRFLMMEPAQDGRAILWTWTICLAVAMMFAIVPTLARTTTKIFIEGDDIVLTGCVRWQPYEDRSPLTQVESRYIDAGRNGKSPELYLLWPNQKGGVRIPLKYSPYLGNLAIIAPDAMAQYVKKLNTDGEPIPAPLRPLAEANAIH